MVTNPSFVFFYIQDFEEVCYEGDNRDLWWLPEDKAWIVHLTTYSDMGFLRTPPTKKVKDYECISQLFNFIRHLTII